VKDSGRCRSCYAFATTGVLEGLHALTTGKLVTLSEQNIIDCSVPYGNRACSGGSVETSLMYVIDSGGLDTDTYYPYKERQYLCKFSKKYIAGKCTGMIKIQKGRESDLEIAVATFGPVTAVVDSRHNTFQFYAGGVFLEPTCSTTKLTQSVLIIGYGKTRHGREYWILKNSWGTAWGMDGYMLMARNLNNHCGIASRALYPSS
ncbi:Procathepsin L (Fragments), partial [Geodia barretti]